MQTWYYSSNGERQGPVSFDELKALARRGGLDAVKDLVWTEGMTDWTASGQVPGLFTDTPGQTAGAFNPYTVPATASQDLLAPLPSSGLGEIPPGSQSLDIMAVIKRAIEITRRNFGRIIGIGLVYMLVSWALQIGLVLMDRTLGWGSSGILPGGIGSGTPYAQPRLSLVASLISFAGSSFLLLGLIRVALNFSSGGPAAVADLFGQGSKLPRMLGAMLLFYLMVAVGLVLLIVPGIYLALRFGFFQYAIVDRNLGVIDSLKYSANLTKNNGLNLFGLFVMIFLVTLAGILALVVGLIFAIPVATLALPLAYRYLQFGPRALTDHPGTGVPVLRGQYPPV